MTFKLEVPSIDLPGWLSGATAKFYRFSMFKHIILYIFTVERTAEFISMSIFPKLKVIKIMDFGQNLRKTQE